MIHPTRVAGGPLAHFKTKRPRSECIRAGTHLCVRMRERCREYPVCVCVCACAKFHEE